MTLGNTDMTQPDRIRAGEQTCRERERLAELERRSLIAEQARHLAHLLRTPLNVIEVICETLQIDLQDRPEESERLEQVLSALFKVSTTLSELVRSTHFAQGAQRPLDAVRTASRLTRLLGGQIECPAEVESMRAEVMAHPDAFEAAIMHGLRLIGVGRGTEQPLLRISCVDGMLTLRLSASVSFANVALRERADHCLMAQAAERAAHDSGGSVELDWESVSFVLPLRSKADAPSLSSPSSPCGKPLTGQD